MNIKAPNLRSLFVLMNNTDNSSKLTSAALPKVKALLHIVITTFPLCSALSKTLNASRNSSNL